MDKMTDASQDTSPHHVNHSMMHAMLNHTNMMTTKMGDPHHGHHVMPTMMPHDHMDSSHDGSMMNHSSHDMMGMDHSSHDMMDHSMNHGTSHDMYFTFGFPKGVLFLEGWTVTSNVELAISLLGLCVIAIFLESITRLTKRASSKTLCYMAKKNLKLCRKLSECVSTSKNNYKKLPRNEDRINDDNEDVRKSIGGGRLEVEREVEITLLNETKHRDEKTDVPLTLPQCLQYRLLLTALHVIRLILGYFLMLSVMTYNWWIFIVVLVGSVIGYLCFGWGHGSTLGMMASSTLPPQIVAKSTLEDELESSEKACLKRQDGSRDMPEAHCAVLIEEHTKQENGESRGYPPEYSKLSSSGLRKVERNVTLQGNVISEKEFTQRLEKSKETDL